MADVEWKLIYWHYLPGRGDFVRLLFEEAGVPYDDVCRREGKSTAVLKHFKVSDPEAQKLFQEDASSYPVSAPPIIVRGDFIMNSTPAILVYLGKKFGLYPSGGDEEEAHALQINNVVTDFVAEGYNCFHPKSKLLPYEPQKEEAEPFIKTFVAERLSKFLETLERSLKANKGGQGFFFGENITYVDIAVFHALRATESQFPDQYRDLPIPTLRAFKSRIQERPNIKAFLESDRSLPFSGNSMM